MNTPQAEKEESPPLSAVSGPQFYLRREENQRKPEKPFPIPCGGTAGSEGQTSESSSVRLSRAGCPALGSESHKAGRRRRIHWLLSAGHKKSTGKAFPMPEKRRGCPRGSGISASPETVLSAGRQGILAGGELSSALMRAVYHLAQKTPASKGGDN